MPEVTKVNPFHSSKIHDQDSNNVFLRQVNFPFKYSKSDVIGSEWSDRIMGRWVEACHKYNKNQSFVGMILSFSEEDFLNFCQELVNSTEKLNGARLVKFVNASSGYTVWRVDYYISRKPVKGHSDSQWAPNITQSDNAIDDWDLFEDNMFRRFLRGKQLFNL